MVLQDVRPGWERKAGPERGEAAHKGEENLFHPKVDRNCEILRSFSIAGIS